MPPTGCSKSTPRGDPSVEPGVGSSEGSSIAVGSAGPCIISGVDGMPGGVFAGVLSELSLEHAAASNTQLDQNRDRFTNDDSIMWRGSSEAISEPKATRVNATSRATMALHCVRTSPPGSLPPQP
jgi:hypothetical protein